jgi:hypothetical protein
MKKIWLAFIEEGSRFIMEASGVNAMRPWIEIINQDFHRCSSGKTSVVGWFGGNGNFVLKSSITSVNEIRDFFCSCTGYNAGIFDLSHIYWLIQEVSSISNFENKNLSPWDKGIGFQLKGTKRYFDEFPIGQHRIWCIERGIAGMNLIVHPKPDLPKSKRKDQRKWSRLSKGLRTNLDGQWTVRSLPMVNGVFERALLFLSNEKTSFA